MLHNVWKCVAYIKTHVFGGGAALQELEYPDVPSTDYNTKAPPANADEVNARSLPAHSRSEAEAHCEMLEVRFTNLVAPCV